MIYLFMYVMKQILTTTNKLLIITNRIQIIINYQLRVGRLVGFPLLRSALEIFITRELFNTNKSSKYSSNQVIFLKKDIPSPKSIINIIERLNLERFFKTDSLRRLYDWQSIVTHEVFRLMTIYYGLSMNILHQKYYMHLMLI